MYSVLALEYEADSYLAVNLTLPLITEPTSYLAVNLTLDNDVVSAAPTDSCTPPAVGNWLITDHCVINSPTTVLGNITCEDGSLTVNADLNYETYLAYANCSINKLDGVMIS